MTRGQKLKELRGKRSQSFILKDIRKKLGEVNGINKNTLSNAENDKTISNTTLEILANYYEVSFDYLKNDIIENSTNENIEINRILGFSDKTIENIKSVNGNEFYKNEGMNNNLNLLFENLDFNIISWNLRDISILKQYYEICRYICRFDYSIRNKEITEEGFYKHINSIDIENLQELYGIRDIIDHLKNIIYIVRKKENKKEIEKYSNTLIDYMNRINEVIGYKKYVINKNISETLDSIFDNKYCV